VVSVTPLTSPHLNSSAITDHGINSGSALIVPKMAARMLAAEYAAPRLGRRVLAATPESAAAVPNNPIGEDQG
jgi:hypothetical protein